MKSMGLKEKTTALLFNISRNQKQIKEPEKD